MRYCLSLPLILGVACSEYELKGPGNTNIAPLDPEEEPLYAPVAMAGPSVDAKRDEMVVLDGQYSYDPDNPEGELTYEWRITEFPLVSNHLLQGETTMAPVFQGDTIGTYVASLTVTDVDGLVSEYDGATMIQVIPYEYLSVDLTWDVPGADVDLHLVAPGYSYYSDGDCYFGNPNPDWGQIGNGEDNPSLAIDDEGYEARERIELDRPLEGIYEIYVHFYNPRDSGTSYVTPTISVSAEGGVIAEITGPRLINAGAVWKAGTIDWTTLTFVDEELVSDHEVLGGPAYND